jgi:hypothetical protein
MEQTVSPFFLNTVKVCIPALLTAGIEIILPSSCLPGTPGSASAAGSVENRAVQGNNRNNPGAPTIDGNGRTTKQPAQLAGFAERALKTPWTVEGVNEILTKSASGRKALKTLGSSNIVVWRVKQIVLWKQRRKNVEAAWPNEWEEESLVGRVLKLNGVRNVWVLDELTNIEAALTVAHEASHTWGYREVQARAFEAGILTEIPQYLPVAPKREAGWVKKGLNEYYVDVKAITKYIEKIDVYKDTKEAAKSKKERLVRYRSDPRGKFPEEMDFGGPEVQGSGFKTLE